MQALLALFRPGRTIFIPGASGEIPALAAALAAKPDCMKGVHLVTCPIPGFNDFDYAALDPAASMTVSMLPQAFRPSFEAGRIRFLPLSHALMAQYIAQGIALDVAVAHVAPPDRNGFCSLGIAADFTPAAWQNAKARILVVNHRMPAMRRGPRLAVSGADVLVEIDTPLAVAKPPRDDAALKSITDRVVALVPDGATLQFGIGGAPAAVWPQLARHRDLTIASGQVGPDLALLARAGALSAGGRHRTGLALGDEEFYQWLASEDLVEFVPVAETHGAAALAGTERFTAINSALEVDLLGQANLEWMDGRQVGGIGGAPDFARAAAQSAGGRSIIALPAEARQGGRSRIVASLNTPTTSIPRNDIDSIVTEHGVAELRGKSIDERAKALIAIAAPQRRDELAAQWSRLRREL